MSYKPSVPAKYVIRSYLREQHAAQKVLFDDLHDRLMERWKAAYRRGKLTGATLEELSITFENSLREAGGFSVGRSVMAPTRAAPYRHRHSVSAFLGSPMSLGRNVLEGRQKAFREPALMIDFWKMDFTPKKGAFGVGFTGLLLTRHVLERIYERTEVDVPAFGGLLHRHLWEFIQGVSLTEAAGLWLLGKDGVSRVSAVPYANGLMLLSSRLLLGDTNDGEFGFQYTFPSGKMTFPYVSRSRFIDTIEGGIPLPRHAQIGLLTCGVTYLDIGSLRSEQQDYYYAFRALQEAVGTDATAASVYCSIAPQLSQEKPVAAVLPEAASQKCRRARSLLGWLDPNQTSPLCAALPYDD